MSISSNVYYNCLRISALKKKKDWREIYQKALVDVRCLDYYAFLYFSIKDTHYFKYLERESFIFPLLSSITIF